MVLELDVRGEEYAPYMVRKLLKRERVLAVQTIQYEAVVTRQRVLSGGAIVMYVRKRLFEEVVKSEGFYSFAARSFLWYFWPSILRIHY